MTRILLSIPAYNEALTIAAVAEAAKDRLKAIPNSEVAILVVDDGSTDNTTECARSIGAHVIRHSQNLGLGIAFRHAVQYAIAHQYDVLLTIDADGQFSPDDIPAIIAPILDNRSDMVTGSRFLADSSVDGIPFAKRWGNHLVTRLVNSITRNHLSDVSCGFRAYNREALLQLHLFGAFTYTHEVLLNLATKRLRISEVPITVTYPDGRHSRIASSLIRYGLRTGSIIFKSTIAYQPFRLFGTLAFVLWGLALPVLIVLGTRYLLTDFITPFKGLALTALVMVGLGFTSFAAGILLEVLRRVQLTTEELLYYAKQNSN